MVSHVLLFCCANSRLRGRLVVGAEGFVLLARCQLDSLNLLRGRQSKNQLIFHLRNVGSLLLRCFRQVSLFCSGRRLVSSVSRLVPNGTHIVCKTRPLRFGQELDKHLLRKPRLQETRAEAPQHEYFAKKVNTCDFTVLMRNS